MPATTFTENYTPSSRRRWLPTLIMAALLMALPILFSGSYHRSILVNFCIWLLLLTGLNLITGYGRMLSLAQAGFYGLGAYTAGIVATSMGMPTIVALVLAPLVVATVALLVGIPTLRLRGMYFVMATLGAGVVLYLGFGRAVSITGGPNGLLGIPPLNIGGFVFNTALRMYVLAATLALLGFVAAENLMRSRTGSGLIALGVSEPGAAVVGVDAFRLRITAFVLSGAYAGVAGSLLTFRNQFVSPSTFDFLTAVVLVVMLTVVGAGTSAGPVVGAGLIVVLDETLASYAEYHALILGLMFLVAIQAFPQGIVGFLHDQIRGAGQERQPPGAEGAPAIPKIGPGA